MKRALYVIMTLVMVVNLYSTYSVAAGADEKEDITDSFLEYVKDEQTTIENPEIDAASAEQKSAPLQCHD